MRPFLLAAAALVAGCHWTLNEPGTEPFAGRLYFPSGIAMDPGRQFLYVSNGNSDLRYSGGTLEMVNVQLFDCAVAQFRNQTLPPACSGFDAGQIGAAAGGCSYDL